MSFMLGSLSYLVIILFSLVLIDAAFLAGEVSANHESAVLYTWLHSSPSPPRVLSDWNSYDKNPCNWTSVRCDQGYVTEISIASISLQLSVPGNLSSLKSLRKLVISDANLTGSIPDDIGDCSSLKILDLRSNAINGTIPASIGKLQNLEYLLLSSNQLTGKIPVEISNCTSLQSLLLYGNRLSGNLTIEFRNMLNLRVLLAGGNKDISGRIPDDIGKCSKLTILGLAGTQISGQLPASLGRLKKLRNLQIYRTMLSGEIPPELGKCSELVNLILNENRLYGPIPMELGKLQKLQQLLLWNNRLTGVIPEEIGNCRSLRILDLTQNSLSGSIPWSLGQLHMLEQFKIGANRISGPIPVDIANATNLIQLELYMNKISGSIPAEMGLLSKLIIFYAYNNHIQGSIPSALSRCNNLQELDLSYNSLSGSIPPGLFRIQSLKLLVLISNKISGSIPIDINYSSNLVRLSLGNNRISGEIPSGIGSLKSLNFLELPGNNLSGLVPVHIGNCTKLQKIDLSGNALEGPLPCSLSSLSNLKVLNVSNNRFVDQIPPSVGSLNSLYVLSLSTNSLSGTIPSSLGLCSRLLLLDLSNNKLTGSIPKELGQLEDLSISFNLSWNELTGPLPSEVSALNKLSILDISHNMLEGDLVPLAELSNLVSLNISFNNFTGKLPDTKVFRQLSPSDLAGNGDLCSSGLDLCFSKDAHPAGGEHKKDTELSWKFKLLLAVLISVAVVLLIVGLLAINWVSWTCRDENEKELEDLSPWEFTTFWNVNFAMDDVLRCLVDDNEIGRGFSGIVYRGALDDSKVIAVKKLWPTTISRTTEHRDLFSTELMTLGLIRHRNIVRLLGCCTKKDTRLLIYDYIPNGSLSIFLHERTGNTLEWHYRYQILLGAAQGLAYLHHDCVPPVLHRDIKANNILIGEKLEPYIADFGLAKLLEGEDFAASSSVIPGSYGYIAPEYGYMRKITEKSDVYSFGVVMLEVLTGKPPIDPAIPDGLHVVDWVRQRKGRIEVIDANLLSSSELHIEEIVHAMRIALLCVMSKPEDRPTMNDVAAMLMDIKHARLVIPTFDTLLNGTPYFQEYENTNQRDANLVLAIPQENEHSEITLDSPSTTSSSSDMPLLIPVSP